MLKNTVEQLGYHGCGETQSMFFDTVIFCTNTTYADGHFKGGEIRLFLSIHEPWSYPSPDLTSRKIETTDANPLEVQEQLAAAWSSLVPNFPTENIHVLPSIEHAISVVREVGSEGGVDVLVAGSLHLVGGVIEVAGLSDVAL